MTSPPGTSPVLVTRITRADELTDDLVGQATSILGRLVAADAALGWVSPPTRREVSDLLTVLVEQGTHNACLVIGVHQQTLAGLGYWSRYERPTHRPHADLEKLAVSPDAQRGGVGRALLAALVDHARAEAIEMLTLDFRGDNTAAESLYLSMGFTEYGRLRDFVAPEPGRRLDKVMHVLDLRRSAAASGQDPST